MGRIQVLPEAVASRIAAGEVVERPASVIKELIENAIDANARAIEIGLEAGGRDAITVTDDGEGMAADDLLLALERHATSKIRSDADVEEVRSLGFRGEAVPSIASVSRFLMVSRDDSSAAASVVEVHGGRLADVREQASPRGTRVEVRGLFYNAPARRKFLRTSETERLRAVEMVMRFAIGYPEIRFRLLSDGKLVFDYAPMAGAIERCAQVLGRQLAGALVPVDVVKGDLRIAGLVSGLAETRAHTRDQHLYVNRRPVRDRLLAHAISATYADLLPRGRSPVLVLLLVLPPQQVDVNVHPSKSEVRFRRPQEIHGLVVEALRDTLRRAGALPGLALGSGPGSGLPAEPAAGEPAKGGAGSNPLPGEGPPAGESALAPSGIQGPLPGSSGYTYARSTIAAGGGGWARKSDEGPWSFSEDAPAITDRSGGPASEGGWSSPAGETSVHPLGQFLDSYILARDGEGLLIVDQHAAHERVLFEGILGDLPGRDGTSPAQRLLTPVPVGLSAAERAALLGQTGPLAESGFEIDEFGGETVLLRTVPAGCEGTDPQRLLREVLSDLREGDRLATLDERRRRVAASAACHAAIKVHFPLTVAKMAWLLGALFRCDTPTTCPHGRPILLRIGREEIERGFLRR